MREVSDRRPPYFELRGRSLAIHILRLLELYFRPISFPSEALNVVSGWFTVGDVVEFESGICESFILGTMTAIDRSDNEILDFIPPHIPFSLYGVRVTEVSQDEQTTAHTFTLDAPNRI